VCTDRIRDVLGALDAISSDTLQLLDLLRAEHGG
jgi:hypothetical protein